MTEIMYCNGTTLTTAKRIDLSGAFDLYRNKFGHNQQELYEHTMEFCTPGVLWIKCDGVEVYRKTILVKNNQGKVERVPVKDDSPIPLILVVIICILIFIRMITA